VKKKYVKTSYLKKLKAYYMEQASPIEGKTFMRFFTNENFERIFLETTLDQHF